MSRHNSSVNTVSVNVSDEFSEILAECSAINIEETSQTTEPQEYKSDFVRALTTQRSIGTRTISVLDLTDGEKEYSMEISGSTCEDSHRIDNSEPIDYTHTVNGDGSFWQSFSNSLQRAYNSTKELCNNIGRRNESKRVLDDVEESQPRPKRAKISILRRPTIREYPRIIFKQVGDYVRPVFGYDKETQTNL